jgi:hypothetical protein
VAYAQAIDKGWEPFGVAVGMLGAVVSVGFWMLDVRNEELVNCGRAALGRAEMAFSMGIIRQDRARGCLKQALGDGDFGGWVAGKKSGRWLFRHRTWLRLIEGSVGLAFAASAVWAATGFPGK